MTIFTAFAQSATPDGVNNPIYIWTVWLTIDNYNNGTWTNWITSSSVGNFNASGTVSAKINSGYNFHPSVQFNMSIKTHQSQMNNY